jgi:hypothetical protein
MQKTRNAISFSGKKKITGALQVCYKLTGENRGRETGGLLEAMNKFQLAQGILHTNDQEETQKSDGKNILIMPVWKWLFKGNIPTLPE